MKHYRIIHDKKKRGKKDNGLTGELLLSKAREMFERMNQERFVRNLAKGFEDLSIKIDLVGTPEVSFVIAVQKGKLRFLTEHVHADMAVGIHKEYFLELLENPPRFGNMKIIYNNIIFRKGRVRVFEYAKPLLFSSLLSGKLGGLMQKNKLSMGH